jgi:hypothetical protein
MAFSVESDEDIILYNEHLQKIKKKITLKQYMEIIIYQAKGIRLEFYKLYLKLLNMKGPNQYIMPITLHVEGLYFRNYDPPVSEVQNFIKTYNLVEGKDYIKGPSMNNYFYSDIIFSIPSLEKKVFSLTSDYNIIKEIIDYTIDDYTNNKFKYTFINHKAAKEELEEFNKIIDSMKIINTLSKSFNNKNLPKKKSSQNKNTRSNKKKKIVKKENA